MRELRTTDNSELKAKLLGSLLLFTRVFFEIRTGRPFNIVEPVSREPRQLTICRELTGLFNGDAKYLMINIQPGSGKTILLQHFVAWGLAHYPDSRFLYLSHSEDLAATHTGTIKQIIEMPEYQRLFGVKLRRDSTAKSAFVTTAGGHVRAFGIKGPVTGHDAGLPGVDRFSGALIIDDAHKPNEVHSDAIREGVITNFHETVLPRLRGPRVPLVGIGQCLHEGDLFGHINTGGDGHVWRKVILPTLDSGGNNLCPDVITTEDLLIMQEKSPYAFASQYQQTPQPAGGALYRKDWFIEYEPAEILTTFITVDSAETEKTHNDATVFSFWGVYRIEYNGIPTGMYGLHWIDCLQLWVEPCNLEAEFLAFVRDCLRYKVQPTQSAIEKKSTGTYLCSLLKNIPGMQIIEIDRPGNVGSKTDRFIKVQPYYSSKRVTLPRGGRHNQLVTDHMAKITANNTHRFDDIADTAECAVTCALIDRYILIKDNSTVQNMNLSRLDRMTAQRSKTQLQGWR